MKRHLRSLLWSAGVVSVCLLAGAHARQKVLPIEQEPSVTSQRAQDWPEFFPLEVGNEWVYSDGAGSFTVQVLRETLEANGMKYFEVSDYFPHDTVKVRKLRRGPLGQILEYNPIGEDFLWYRFGNFRVGMALRYRRRHPLYHGQPGQYRRYRYDGERAGWYL